MSFVYLLPGRHWLERFQMFLQLLARLTKSETLLKKWLDNLCDEVYVGVSQGMDIVLLDYSLDDKNIVFVVTYLVKRKTLQKEFSLPKRQMLREFLPISTVCSIVYQKTRRDRLFNNF